MGKILLFFLIIYLIIRIAKFVLKTRIFQLLNNYKDELNDNQQVKNDINPQGTESVDLSNYGKYIDYDEVDE